MLTIPEIFTSVKTAYNLTSAKDITRAHLIEFIPSGADWRWWQTTLRNYEYNQGKPKRTRRRTRCNQPRKSHNYAADVARRDAILVNRPDGSVLE